MSKEYSSWTSDQPLSPMNTNLTIIKLLSVKGDQQDQFKNLERVEASSHMSNDVDVSSSPSTRINTRAIRPVVILKKNASYFATPSTIRSPLTNEQSKVSLVEKPLEDTTAMENVSSAPKRNHKHKHHHHRGKHHHHHHHCRHHHHHHPNRPHRVKSVAQQQHQQKPTIVYREVSNHNGYTVDTNVPYVIGNEKTLVNDQQTPLVVYRDANTQQSVITDDRSQPVFLNQDQETKPSKGNIPLQSVENKLVSQRVSSAEETQVGNFPPMICAQPTPSIINTGGVQQIEQIFYEDNCCYPSSTINCAPDPCAFSQYDPCFCLPQQQQQQIFLCTDPNSAQDFICSSSNNNCIQQTSLPQQQIIYVDNTSATGMQSTSINQLPFFNSLSTNSASQPLLCVPQTSVQQTASYVIQQQPQIQAQPIQYIQVSSASPQIIQTPQTQSAQYIQVSSATPQIIQTIQSPGIQNIQPQIIQIPTQNVVASPQILYQRPYDPIVIPFQNQQLAVAQNPMVALSHPSYAPARIVSATPTQQTVRGPSMFRHALVRTVANRTGVPVPLSASGGLQLAQPSMGNQIGGTRLTSTARALFNGGSQRSAPLPIVPLSAGGLLIPFKPSQPPKGLTPGALPRPGGYPSNLINFNNIRQQIQQRAQFLADLQGQNSTRIPSLPIHSATTAIPSPASFSRNAPLSPPVYSRSVPLSSPVYSRSILQQRPPFPSSLPSPPSAVIRSQTPYASGNAFSTSSSSSNSSSSRSTASSTLPASSAAPPTTGLIYSQPSVAGSRGGSLLSGPSTTYQSLRP